MASKLRDAIVDAVDERNEMVVDVAERGVRVMRRAVAAAVVTAAERKATPEQVKASIVANRRFVLMALLLGAGAADAQSDRDVKALRKAGKGKHEGPVGKRDVEERRGRRLAELAFKGNG